MVAFHELVKKRAAMRHTSAYLLMALFCVVATSSAQRADELLQQLQQLKKEYQDKLQELDQRLAALEAQKAVSTPTQVTPQQTTGQQSTGEVSPLGLGNALGQGLKSAVSGS